MATTALNMMELDQHIDEGTDETSTTDSCMEEAEVPEVPVMDLEEKLEENLGNKEETPEPPLELSEENTKNEEIAEDGKMESETETGTENETEAGAENGTEAGAENGTEAGAENGSGTETITDKEEEQQCDGSIEMLSPSSEDTIEEESPNEHKKTDMIMLPFVAEEMHCDKSDDYENLEILEENDECDEMSENKSEPVIKPKKSRKQEIVIMTDLDTERGLLPDYDTSAVYEIMCQLPIIRRCFIEHSYFKNEMYTANLYVNDSNQLYNSNLDVKDLSRNDTNDTSRTLPYENKRKTTQTSESECYSGESLDSSTSSGITHLLQPSTRSSFESETNFFEDSSESDESVISVGKMARYELLRKADRKIQKAEEIKIVEDIDKGVTVSFDDIDKELSEMENMINKKTKEMQMPGLMRIGNSVRGRNVDIPLQIPQLKKKGEITEIDMILSRISEMNAQNLTIAIENLKEEKYDPSRKPEIKVKSVENINEELQKLENGPVLLPQRNFRNLGGVKKKPILMPLSANDLTKENGTYFRLVNFESPSKIYRISGNDRPITKPKAPSSLFPINRSKKFSSKFIPENYTKIQENRVVLPVKSVEQKIVPPPQNTRFIKLVPYEPEKVKIESRNPPPLPKPIKVEPLKRLDVSTKVEKSQRPEVKKQVSLHAFSNILKTILPESWLVTLEPRHGLQILKTQIDGQLNPTIMLSVVVGRCGKIRINVRGRQLDKSHEIFSNIGNIANSEGKISVFYVLSLIEKLKMYSVCSGCDDPSLQKYWSDDGWTEIYGESQKTVRSHSCELLVHLNKKRCYTCHRFNEKLKKQQRKELLEKKDSPEEPKEISEIEKPIDRIPPAPEKNLERNLKRNLEEESFEESFLSIKRQITDEIEKRRMDTAEKVPKTQEEVLSFMGLTRKDTLEANTVRKSKREKKNFNKFEPNDINVSQMELDYLEKYWNDINTLFSTSLLFGAYSRTGSGRLRAKCITFHKILKKWQEIIRDNPDWIGSDLVIYDQTLDEFESGEEIFGDMSVVDLRKYLINAVKEVGKIKSRLKSKNSYFKCLYNKFVKRRAKRQKKEQAGNSVVVENTDESSREKDDKFLIDENKSHPKFLMECVSDEESNF